MATPSIPAGGDLTAGSHRPTGVTVLAIIQFIGAFFAGMMGVMALVGGVGAIAGGFFLLLAASAIAVGVSLLARKRWAWYVALVFAGLQVLMGLGALVSFDIFVAVLDIGIGGAIAWYLLTPPVQSWFGVSHNVPWNQPPAA